MTPPVLYSFRRCPYAMRARLALAASGQRCELREVELKRKPPEMLAASAFLLGAQATLVDAALMPFVRQYAMVEPAWFEAQPWPRLRAWLADWIASPLFDSVMRKNPPWRSGEAGIAFP